VAIPDLVLTATKGAPKILEMMDSSAGKHNTEEEEATHGTSETASITMECTEGANATTEEEDAKSGEPSSTPNANPDGIHLAAVSADLPSPTAELLD